MRISNVLVASSALGSGLVFANPIARQTSSTSACANITQQYNTFKSNKSNSGLLIVDGQLAYACLNSMPFDATRGAAFVREVEKYLQFQSTIPLLKDPPKTYLSPPTDLLAGIEQIYQKANTSQYKSQFQMDTDLNNLLNSANDGHLAASFCSQQIFAFQIDSSDFVLPVSTDGASLPKLYLRSDAALLADGNQNVSEVTQINGQNATQFLLNLGLTQRSQDPDAQWNALFYSYARGLSGIFSSEGALYFNLGIWPGYSNLQLSMSNGSTHSLPIVASLVGNISSSGESVFRDNCLPGNSTTSGVNKRSLLDKTSGGSKASTSSTLIQNYPPPIVNDTDLSIRGYYLNDTQFNDTAVLSIPTFDPEDQNSFRNAASLFVNRSVADGKTRMIIDVSGNGGGDVTAGFDLFKLFFPDMALYSASRMRVHPAEQLMAKAGPAFNLLLQSDNQTRVLQGQVITADDPWAYQTQVTPNQDQGFATVEALYGPHNVLGANMTNVSAELNFTLVSELEVMGFSDEVGDGVRGYGGIPLNVTGRPFKPENILIISDGFCASTCTIFVNLMTNPQFGGVKSIATGGRPINAPMQSMGGTRGSQDLSWSSITTLARTHLSAVEKSMNISHPVLTPQEILSYREVVPFGNWPLKDPQGAVNLRNSYNPEDFSTPLQFTYQPANCKLFNTYENFIKPDSVWTSAARAMWGNGTCVPNSKVANTTTQYSFNSAT